MEPADRLIPFPFRSRIGTIHDGDELWGYLYVWQDVLTKPRLIGRTVREECLWEEMFRVLPVAPDAPDHMDPGGWRDTVVTGDDLGEEIEQLRRGELRLLGRNLPIRWLDGEEAEAVWDRYFAKPSP